MNNAAVAPANENIETDSTMSEEGKRAAIRERIEAGEADLERRQDHGIAEQLTEAKDAAVDFTRRHPLTILAGGFIVGLAISALFKNSPTRKLGRYSATYAALAADAARDYGRHALDAVGHAGRVGLETLDDFGDRAGDNARGFRRTASYKAAGALDRSKIARREAIKGSRRSMNRAKDYLSH